MYITNNSDLRKSAVDLVDSGKFYSYKGDLITAGNLDLCLDKPLHISGDVLCAALNATCGLKANSITVSSSIYSDGAITAVHDISAGGCIYSRCSIRAGGNITAKSYIVSRQSIRSVGSIEAGAEITAVNTIYAHRFIKSGQYIRSNKLILSLYGSIIAENYIKSAKIQALVEIRAKSIYADVIESKVITEESKNQSDYSRLGYSTLGFNSPFKPF